jgi:pimeloyl-ACP methyl ester carboxylesterase
MKTTHVLDHAQADITYDVRVGRPLLMIGQPMDASGFRALSEHFPERTVVTYDPRGAGRSTRRDGRVDASPTVQAEDVHAVIEAVGGPVDLFASSGGAVTALALVAAHPDDVVTLVAHEPPLIEMLPDREAARRATDAVTATYMAKGWGHGMAAFMALTTWQGEYTDAYFAQPAPDPAQFGFPTTDDGTREDPLLTDRAAAIRDYVPDAEALAAAPTRIVIGVGEESRETFTGRTAIGTAAHLGLEPVVFPSHHGGFLDGEFGWPGRPAAFAAKLREVLV